jgi:hypothetical protein
MKPFIFKILSMNSNCTETYAMHKQTFGRKVNPIPLYDGCNLADSARQALQDETKIVVIDCTATKIKQTERNVFSYFFIIIITQEFCFQGLLFPR